MPQDISPGKLIYGQKKARGTRTTLSASPSFPYAPVQKVFSSVSFHPESSVFLFESFFPPNSEACLFPGYQDKTVLIPVGFFLP